jgi:hypothetical protein
MGTRDLVLVRVDERAPAHDVGALDDEAVDAMRRRQDETGDRVGGAAELESARVPYREVGPLSGLQ